jgi:hypothetical protein
VRALFAKTLEANNRKSEQTFTSALNFVDQLVNEKDKPSDQTQRLLCAENVRVFCVRSFGLPTLPNKQTKNELTAAIQIRT